MTLREVMKDKQIYLRAEWLNSKGWEGCENNVLSVAERFTNNLIHAAKQSADECLLCGPLILEEKSGVYRVVQEEQPIILHFIFLAVVIDELHQRNMITVEVNHIFEDLLKYETVYRIHLDQASNQLLRDKVIDRTVYFNDLAEDPVEIMMSNICDLCQKKLINIDNNSLQKLFRISVNANFDVVHL